MYGDKKHLCLKYCAPTFGGKLRRSPLGSVSNLLSSRTELRFSTHSGSTSPSKMIHWRFCSSPRTLSIILKLDERFLPFIYKTKFRTVNNSKMWQNSLPEDVREQAISPFASVGVQGSIQVVLADGLGVNYVSHTLNTLQPLQSFEQHPPCHSLSTAWRSHHHQTMVDLCDLVQLENLRGEEWQS